MTSPPLRKLPLPISTDNLCAAIGLDSLPELTLVDLTALDKMVNSKSFEPGLFLTASELEKYESYAYPKRKREWFGGRISAKLAGINKLDMQRGSTFLDWQIIPDQHGRPFLKPVSIIADFPAIEISISHSKDLCVALAVFNRPCGIDIQQSSQAVVRVQEKFCTRKEKVWTETLENIEDEEMRLTLLWSAKEALRKSLGGNPLTGFPQMNLNRVDSLAEKCWAFSFEVNLNTETFSHRVVSFIYHDYGCSVSCK